MSWTWHSMVPVESGEIQELPVETQTAPDGCESACRDQIVAAKVAARVLASSVGLQDDLVRVVLSGHANPNHAPADGWGDEYISVSVYRIERNT